MLVSSAHATPDDDSTMQTESTQAMVARAHVRSLACMFVRANISPLRGVCVFRATVCMTACVAACVRRAVVLQRIALRRAVVLRRIALRRAFSLRIEAALPVVVFASMAAPLSELVACRLLTCASDLASMHVGR